MIYVTKVAKDQIAQYRNMLGYHINMETTFMWLEEQYNCVDYNSAALLIIFPVILAWEISNIIICIRQRMHTVIFCLFGISFELVALFWPLAKLQFNPIIWKTYKDVKSIPILQTCLTAHSPGLLHALQYKMAGLSQY